MAELYRIHQYSQSATAKSSIIRTSAYFTHFNYLLFPSGTPATRTFRFTTQAQSFKAGILSLLPAWIHSNVMIAPKARAASGILYVYNSENNNHIYSAIVDVKGTCVLAIPPPEKVIWYAIVLLEKSNIN